MAISLIRRRYLYHAMGTMHLSHVAKNLSIAFLAAAVLSVAAIFSAAPLAHANLGDQGCTPGYWKQDQHFDSYPAGITPDTQLDVLLGFELPGYETLTVLQALNLQGSLVNKLISHGTAGLLNDAHVDVNYQMSTTTTIRNIADGLDPVLSTTLYDPFDPNDNNDNDLELRKNFLDAANNGVGGCPLN